MIVQDPPTLVTVGELDGAFDGAFVGALDGALDGAFVGALDGALDGALLGALLKPLVNHPLHVELEPIPLNAM